MSWEFQERPVQTNLGWEVSEYFLSFKAPIKCQILAMGAFPFLYSLCIWIWSLNPQITLYFLFKHLIHLWLSGKESPCQCRRPRFDSWVGKISWRRKWQPIPVFSPGESCGQRSLEGYSSWGRKELDSTEQLNKKHCRTSLVARMVKYLPTMWETWVWSLGQEDPLEKAMATHSSTLAWRIPWMEEPGRLQFTGSKRVRHD